MPRVSVVIPAYNGRAFLREAVASVVRQSLADWELVVVDDGSTDGTGDLARGLAASNRRISVLSQPNSGVSVARNRGLDATTAPYLLFLDADDYLEPLALEQLVAALDRETHAPAVHGLPRTVAADGSPISAELSTCYGFDRQCVAGGRLAPMVIDAPTSFETLVVWPCIATPGQVLVRRESALAAGGFDPAIRVSQDWDFWLRLSLLGSLPRVLAFVLNKRIHPASVTQDGKRIAGAERIVRYKTYRLPELGDSRREIARAGHRLSCRVKFDWALDSLRQEGAASAARQAFRAARSYWDYLKMPYPMLDPMLVASLPTAEEPTTAGTPARL